MTVLASAGTRKDGRVIDGEAASAAAALARLGASMVLCAFFERVERMAALVVVALRVRLSDESFNRAQKLQDAMLMSAMIGSSG